MRNDTCTKKLHIKFTCNHTYHFTWAYHDIKKYESVKFSIKNWMVLNVSKNNLYIVVIFDFSFYTELKSMPSHSYSPIM
jgi:hypothetical protein